MAYSDWSFIVSNGNSQHLAKPYGNDFAAPITGSGDYCRELRNQMIMYASGSQFIDVGREYAVRIQALVKGSATLFVNAGETAYGFSVNNGYQLTAYPYYWTSGIEMSTPLNGNSGLNSITDGTIPFPSNNWNSLRLTVYPISPTEDRIIGEVEQGIGSGTWLKTFTNQNNTSITLDRVVSAPSYSNRRSGVTTGTDGTGYFDKLSISLALAPVAIP